MTAAAFTGREPGVPDRGAAAGLELPLTDLGNAERLVADHASDIRFVPPDHGWHVWDGKRWRPDGDGEITRKMKETIRSFHRAAIDVDDDEKRRAKLIAHALRWEQLARITAAAELARADSTVIAPIDTLDAYPMLFNVANGTLDLEAGELGPHSRDDLLTKITAVPYMKSATAPRWAGFLHQVFADDAELVDFVQRAVGYSLTGATVEQVVFLLHGHGANGKSTFVEILRRLFGEYGQQAPSETFLAARNDRIRNDVARLAGARFVAAVETGEGRRLDEPLVKQLTGGDTIAARQLYREHFEFVPQFKAWLATNHLPEIRGTDEAIWRRVRRIPFNVTFTEDERDPRLVETLRAELPGILRWAVEGCRLWLEHGLNPPSAVLDATREYRDDMDVLGAFLVERTDNGDAFSTPARPLYECYVKWADAAGERDQLSEKGFSTRLQERGYTKTRTGRGIRWNGIAVRPEGVQGVGT